MQRKAKIKDRRLKWKVFDRLALELGEQLHESELLRILGIPGVTRGCRVDNDDFIMLVATKFQKLKIKFTLLELGDCDNCTVGDVI